jgi:hypothetical protein
MAEIDERKALDRLGQSLRNLINGARPGTGLDDDEEPETPAPGAPQLAPPAPDTAERPPS